MDREDNLNNAAELAENDWIKFCGYTLKNGDVKSIFKKGVEWADKNKEEPKVMCIRDKTKECNLCHECDVSVLNPSY